MPETHLRQQGFTYGACEPFNQNELDKACFQHDMAYIDSKD